MAPDFWPVAQELEPEIDEYAIIGDCRTAALVSRAGSIDWLCLPHFSGPSVFAALLDSHKGGRFSISPVAEFSPSRHYLPGTPILETTFRTASGTARLLDFMPIGGSASGLLPMREMLRVIEGVEGELLLDIHYQPRPNYGREPSRVARKGALGWSCSWKDELHLLASEAPLDVNPDGSAVTGRARIKSGERLCLSLSYVKGEIAVCVPLGEHAWKRLEQTQAWWGDWSGRLNYVGPYREAVERSAITLKLMTYALSGAVVAAPTTSLPEAIRGDRNWDYRYCWLRDASLTMTAFTGLGCQGEAASFLQWLLHATRLTWPKLQVVYDVYGRTNLPEKELEHLRGYRASQPVRVGNGAYSQTQLDVYGGVISAAHRFVQSGGKLDRAEARLLRGFGEVVGKHWRDPDHGIWEIRGKKRHHTSSKVMCWVALDRLIQLAERGSVPINQSRLREERDAIRTEIETKGFNPAINAYVSELGGDKLDTALLLMGCLGYHDPRHPRMRSTLEQLVSRLGRNGLLYRYEQGSDGLGSVEGAFGISGFWAVENLARRGDVQDARAMFEHLLSFSNDVGLFAEETDPSTGKALGNFPQAFTHVGLINAALALAEADGGQRI